MPENEPSNGNRSAADLLDIADAANLATKRADRANAPVDIFEFTQQLAFLLTIGYLTKPQATALHDWFESQGTLKLPDLPGPDGIAGPRMYEILVTRIHFGPRGSATGPESFSFGSLLAAVSNLITTVTDGVSDVLSTGTSLIHAATEFVHEVHSLVSEVV